MGKNQSGAYASNSTMHLSHQVRFVSIDRFNSSPNTSIVTHHSLWINMKFLTELLDTDIGDYLFRQGCI